MTGMKAYRVILPLAVLLAAPAAGQRTGPAGFNSHAPVDVAADRIEVNDRVNRASFAGNVLATQGNLRMNAARLTVVYAGSGNVQIERLEASGGVVLRTSSETARSQFAIYDLDRKIVTMIGGVTLDQGRNHVQGGRLVLDLTTRRAVMDGNAGSAGRVSGRFIVPERQGNAP